MLTKEDKKAVLKAFKLVDVKKMELDHHDPMAKKWFRFGSYSAMQIATEIIKQMPEKEPQVS